VLFVRYTLSNIRNTTPVMTTPKTKSSHAWVGLSARVAAALERQAHRQATLGVTGDLVFSQPSGAPLRPESVLHHFHRLCAAARVPRIRVHDLRHLAATLMISSQVPLAMASKTLRHSKLSITVDTYGHLVPYAAQQAVDAIATPSLTPKCPGQTPEPHRGRQRAITLRPQEDPRELARHRGREQHQPPDGPEQQKHCS